MSIILHYENELTPWLDSAQHPDPKWLLYCPFLS